MAFEILPIPVEQVEALQGQLAQVYRSAFAGAPHFETEADVERFLPSLLRHVERSGFRCCIAREPAGPVLGFTYGYLSQAGQWWHDVVAQAMERRMAEAWLADAFEFVLLAVNPQAQGQGIGGRLHDALLDGLPSRAAVLSTRQIEAPALRLYQKRGWVPLLQDFFFPGGTDPFLVMGLDLKQGK